MPCVAHVERVRGWGHIAPHAGNDAPMETGVSKANGELEGTGAPGLRPCGISPAIQTLAARPLYRLRELVEWAVGVAACPGNL